MLASQVEIWKKRIISKRNNSTSPFKYWLYSSERFLYSISDTYLEVSKVNSYFLVNIIWNLRNSFNWYTKFNTIFVLSYSVLWHSVDVEKLLAYSNSSRNFWEVINRHSFEVLNLVQININITPSCTWRITRYFYP